VTAQLPRLLRQREVLALLGGISRVTLWQWRKAGAFPEPLRLGPNVIAWPEPVIARWLEARAQVGAASS
jgi:prophage regulatory protein